jgi:signal peptidase I
MMQADFLNSILLESYKSAPISSCKVISNSMFPLIKKGDWVFVKPTPAEKLNPGDILIFQNQRRFVVHRIVKKTNNHLITKGDWTKTLDSPISTENVIGKVIAIRRGKIKMPITHPIFISYSFVVNLYNQIYLWSNE